MWLLKTEPTAYSYDDLERDRRTVWDGITNPVAIRNLGAMKEGDRAYVYHTGGVKAAVGVARVARAAYPDPKLKDTKRLVVELEPLSRLPRAVGLDEIKRTAVFEGSPLVRQGRLSVVPLSKEQWDAIEEMSRR